MYEIRTDGGGHVYYQGDADYTAYDIECVTERGEAGYLQFTIPNSNPMWKKLETRKTVLEFVCDGESIGFFEVREVSHDMRFSERVYAVGELAWLLDSVQPQAEFHGTSARDFLAAMLSAHNAQCPEHQFRVGTVNVADSNDSLYRFTNRERTLDDIRDKLVDRLGGQIKLRRANGARYIDYLTDATYGGTSRQRVYFGENMLDYSDTMTAGDVCSEVVPLGARLENDSGDNSSIGNLEKRVTVESVNGGSDCVSNSSLVARFGHVRAVQTWDDVTLPENLLAKAREWLTGTQFERMHLTVKAVDLSLTSSQFERLRMGEFVQVVAKPYGIDKLFPITKRTYHPDSPSSDVIELNDDVSLSYVKTQAKATRAAASAAADTERAQTQQLVESTSNTSAMLTGERGGYRKTEYSSKGEWQADYYLDSANPSNAKKVHRVDRNGDAYSTTGIDGPYEQVYTGTLKAGGVELTDVKSGDDVIGATAKVRETSFKFANGALVGSSSSTGASYILATRKYVDSVVPSDAKSTSFNEGLVTFAKVTSGEAVVGLKVTPSTASVVYTKGFLTSRTVKNDSSYTVPLKSYVDAIIPSGAKTSSYNTDTARVVDVTSGGDVIGVQLTPTKVAEGFTKGCLTSRTTSTSTARTVPLKSYVDAIIPSGAKTQTYSDSAAAAELVKSGNVDVGVKITPYAYSHEFKKGCLTSRTKTGGTSYTVALKTYVDNKVPTFTLSGTTLTIRV